jgi:hypothetical protein
VQSARFLITALAMLGAVLALLLTTASASTPKSPRTQRDLCARISLDPGETCTSDGSSFTLTDVATASASMGPPTATGEMP